MTAQIQPQADSPNFRLLYSVPQFLEIANLSRSGFYAEVNSGRLKTVKKGRRRFVTHQAAQDWVQLLTEESEAE